MRLETDKNRLQLTLCGYRHPDDWNDPWDANWLVIALEAETAEGTWRAKEPVLLTREVRYLARWLDDLAAGAGVESLEFLDGAIACRAERQRLPAGLTLSFGMSFRMAPPWVETTPYWISFEADPAMLARAAADLRRQARGWPPRAGWQHE